MTDDVFFFTTVPCFSLPSQNAATASYGDRNGSVATVLDEAIQPSKRVPLLRIQDFFRFQLKQRKRTIQSMHGDAIT